MRTAALALLAAAALPASASAPANAAMMTGDTLHETCSAAETSTTYAQDMLRCRAYIMGAYDDYMAARQAAQEPSCEPEGSTNDVIDTIVRNMRDNPAFNDSHASNLVRVAIIAAWPNCSTASTQENAVPSQ